MTYSVLGIQIIKTGIFTARSPVYEQFDPIFIQLIPITLDIIITHLANHYPYNDLRLFRRDNFQILGNKRGVG